MQKKMVEGEIEGNRSMVMEVEAAWNLGGMRVLSCMRVGIGILVSVLLVLLVVLVWTVLMVCVVVGVLVVVIWTVMVQGVLVEVYCVGVVSGSNSGSFVVVVVLDDFALVLWCSSRMALWCWNERGNFLRAVAGNM